MLNCGTILRWNLWIMDMCYWCAVKRDSYPVVTDHSTLMHGGRGSMDGWTSRNWGSTTCFAGLTATTTTCWPERSSWRDWRHQVKLMLTHLNQLFMCTINDKVYLFSNNIPYIFPHTCEIVFCTCVQKADAVMANITFCLDFHMTCLDSRWIPLISNLIKDAIEKLQYLHAWHTLTSLVICPLCRGCTI